MKNNQKVFAGIVLIGVIALVVYSAWSKKVNNINQDEPLSTSTQADTSNWKTYTNNQYGFEFKYPSDLINTKYSDDGTNLSLIWDGGLGAGRTLWVNREIFLLDNPENSRELTSLDEIANDPHFSGEFAIIGNFRVLKINLRGNASLVIEPKAGLFISFETPDKSIYNILLNSLKSLKK